MPELTSSVAREPTRCRYFRMTTIWASSATADDDVEMVAGHDDDVEIGRDTIDPVELLEGVVEVGNEKTLHRGRTGDVTTPTASDPQPR